MRPFTSTIEFDEALRRVTDAAAAAPIDRVDRVPLTDAAGRVAAADIVSDVDVPAFDRAAMDGYAVIAADTASARADAPVALRRIGRVFTGETPNARVTPGTCVEVATGALMPGGADAVTIVEHTTREGDLVRVHTNATPGQHIGRRGADITRGRAVVRAGDLITPARVGAMAAVGAAEIDVYARPAVAILATGDEVVRQGRPLGPGEVYDVNSFTLSTLVRAHGGAPAAFPPAGDSLPNLVETIDRLAAHDVIVLAGGSSVGERDLVRDAIGARGEILFHGIAMRPGKPTLFGRAGRSFVFGLPGYPTSCLSTGYLLLVPLVRALARLPPWTPRQIELPLARRVTSVAGRRQFYTVRVADGQAHPAYKASGDITSMAEADGYIDIPADVTAIDAGARVLVTLF